jgi:hypothetical protein
MWRFEQGERVLRPRQDHAKMRLGSVTSLPDAGFNGVREHRLMIQRVTHFTKCQMLVASFALLGIATLCGPAFGWNSARNLSGFCATLVEELDKGVAPLSYRSIVCITYFQGVGDALLRQGGADPKNRCMVNHYLNLDDLRHARVFEEYLQKNPSRSDDFASDVIRDSLEEVCRQ